MRQLTLTTDFTRQQISDAYKRLDVGQDEEVVFRGPAPKGIDSNGRQGYFLGLRWETQSGVVPTLVVVKKNT